MIPDEGPHIRFCAGCRKRNNALYKSQNGSNLITTI
jgi:hypothetical protein